MKIALQVERLYRMLSDAVSNAQPQPFWASVLFIHSLSITGFIDNSNGYSKLIEYTITELYTQYNSLKSGRIPLTVLTLRRVKLAKKKQANLEHISINVQLLLESVHRKYVFGGVKDCIFFGSHQMRAYMHQTIQLAKYY